MAKNDDPLDGISNFGGEIFHRLERYHPLETTISDHQGADPMETTPRSLPISAAHHRLLGNILHGPTPSLDVLTSESQGSLVEFGFSIKSFR